MKSIMKSVLLSAAVVSFCSFLPGDDCTAYITARKGAQLEYKHFNEKNKLTGITKNTVMDVRSGGQEFEIRAEAYDAKNELKNTGTYVVLCENGSFHIDMRSMISPEQLESFKDMKITVQADKLDIPSNPTEGQQLKNGNFTMTGESEGSPIKFKLTANVTNRKVEALEDVTTEMGSFPCVKITYDLESKMIFTVKSKVSEWYSKGVGLIKSETYNSKGKLAGSTILASRGMK